MQSEYITNIPITITTIRNVRIPQNCIAFCCFPRENTHEYNIVKIFAKLYTVLLKGSNNLRRKGKSGTLNFTFFSSPQNYILPIFQIKV